MCLAILKPAGKILPEDHIREGWISNPDGGGYGFVEEPGKIVVRKGFHKLKEFVDSYKADEEKYKDSPFLVHFRICTMGAKDDTNTHPFETEHGILIHNGTLTGTEAKYGAGKSDTALFAESFSKYLTFDFVYNHKKELDSALSHNKIALLYKDRRWIILNEDAGRWVEGIWYSNNGYLSSASSHWNRYGDGYYE